MGEFHFAKFHFTNLKLIGVNKLIKLSGKNQEIEICIANKGKEQII